jgi:hypothetical protein
VNSVAILTDVLVHPSHWAAGVPASVLVVAWFRKPSLLPVRIDPFRALVGVVQAQFAWPIAEAIVPAYGRVIRGCV